MPASLNTRFKGIRPLTQNRQEDGGVDQEVEGEGEADEDKVKRLETVEGGEPDEVPMAVLRDPGNPTTKEREDHMASHLPYRSWCHICVEAKGKEDPHYRNRVKEIGQVPVIGWIINPLAKAPQRKIRVQL